jgi:hypothetical protein
MANLNYQNPNQANVTAVLNSETTGTDPTTGQEIRQEFVIPVDSISGHSVLTEMAVLLEEIVTELKMIRILLEADVPPGIADEMDEAQDQTGRGDSTEEGIEDQ